MSVASRLAGVCGLLAMANAASAQTSAQASGAQASGSIRPGAAVPNATVPGVTVTAPSNLTPIQQVERFGQVDPKGRLARWAVPICPVAVGLPPDFDAFIVQRIRAVADQVDARAAPEPCGLNVLILVTPHPGQLSRWLVKYKSRLLASDRQGIDRAKLETFAASKDPVRWLYVSDTTQTTGSGVALPPAIGAAGDALAAFFGHTALAGQPQFAQVVPSRLQPTGDETFSQVVIIVDASRIAGFSAGQVADYLAMIALANVRAESSFAGTNTVLNLFAPGRDETARPTGLTNWDTDYLSALYKSDAQATYSSQISHITTRIKAEQAQPAAADAPK